MNRAVFCSLIAATALSPLLLRSQLSVRPTDPLGYSTRLPRVPVVHSDDPLERGSSMNIQQSDPWLAYKIGSTVFSHEWTRGEGVFSDFVSVRPLADGITNSCGMCHSNPPRAPGSGPTVAEPGSFGRNVPALFGIGIVEILAQQMRAQILLKYDLNHNGFLDVPSEVAGKDAVIEAAAGVEINLGPLDSRFKSGMPALNDVVQIVFVDRNGIPVQIPSGKVDLNTPGVAGYDFAVAAITSSLAIDQEPSIRHFVTNAFRVVLGLPFQDGTLLTRTGKTAWGATSNAGVTQWWSPPPPVKVAANERTVSEGEMDLLEWYLLNSPRPAVAKQTAETLHGKRLMRSLGCTSCHVENWQIQPSRPNSLMPGDRRFFDLAVDGETADGHLQGHFTSLSRTEKQPDGSVCFVPRRGGATIQGIYSDLLYHNLGDRFHEFRAVNHGKLLATTRFRTTPLWGVGTTAPYGHDGRSLNIDDVIRRHGGEAESAQVAFVAASEQDRRDLIAFLESLVLYQPDQIPVDLNHDGRIDTIYRTSNGPAGPERFEPELLFRVPPRYRGWTTGPDRDRYFSYELLNAKQAYDHEAIVAAHMKPTSKLVSSVVQGVSSTQNRPPQTER